MSTRALIGKLNDDGTIDSIYLHLDGYLDGAGATLRAHYASDAAATALLALGNCSGLGDTLDECTFYARDRGESVPKNAAARVATTALFKQAASDAWAQHAYLWNGRQWRHTKI